MTFPIAASQPSALTPPLPRIGLNSAMQPAAALSVPISNPAPVPEWPRYWPGSVPIQPLRQPYPQSNNNDQQSPQHGMMPTGIEHKAHLQAHEALGGAAEMVDSLAERALRL